MLTEALRCVIIPDVHQNIAWVERILDHEKGANLIVFLGDYFDFRQGLDRRASVADTCQFLNKARLHLGSRAVFLLGNHDVQYLEARSACLTFRTPRHLRYACGASFRHSAAKEIAKHLAPEFWSQTCLCVGVNGWLLSHAGLASAHWPVRPTLDESLAALQQICRAAHQSITKPTPIPCHPLLTAGRVRGGDAFVGGLTWLDWDDEFADELPMPQVVGHTSNQLGARQKGRSWCIDGLQTCYGTLTSAGFAVANLPKA
ncbi:MAG: hypothetical protein EAZ36_02130 [Verrucomicrobia bacterium]|nr:MAG: hypothetical protein EAZ36_02130 [Verrucomicrobiota bacterium]